MEKLLKELREKAKKCGTKTKEDRARKGAYVDCIIAIEKQLALCNVVGRSEQLKAFIVDYINEFEQDGTTGWERYDTAKELIKSL